MRKTRSTKRKADGKKAFRVRTQAAVSEFFGVALPTVHLWAKQGMPGRSGAYDLREIVQWLRTAGPWRQHVKPDSSGDPDLDGIDSPGLERYRLAKAQLAELDLETRRGSLVTVARVKQALARWATCVRHLGIRLTTRYGPDAGTAVNETLNECERVIVHEFSTDGSANEAAD